LISFVLSVIMNTSQINAAQVNTRQIAAGKYYDKVRGAWIGELIGNYSGLPYEFKFNENPGNDESITFVVRENWETDDDNSLEWLDIHIMEQYGFDTVTYRQISREWIDHCKEAIWVANYNARLNMLKGILPPYSGQKKNNKDWASIDAQIECEIFGQIAPGMIDNALGRTDYWARVTNDDYAVDTAKFYAAICSEAFFESDPAKTIEKVKSKFGSSSTVYKMASDVQAWCAKYPDWKDTRKQIKDKYNENPAYARLNFCSTLMSLLYGKGDFKSTIQIAILAGWDCDCNAATVGAILGAIKGFSGLPADLTAKCGDKYKNTNRAGLKDDTVSNIALRIQTIAEKNIVARGGSIVGSGESKKYVIVDGAFTPPKIEPEKVISNVIPGRIEAENCTSIRDMTLEETGDGGNGVFVGDINDKAKLYYNVQVKTAGTYKASFRVASSTAKGVIELRKKDNSIIASLNIPDTGGVDKWKTISTTVKLEKGDQVLRLYAKSGGWNFNWMQFDLVKK